MFDDDWRAVHRLGHRNYVGGNDDYWDSIGALQFEFLKSQGLRPDHTFMDIGSGSLRGGARFIEYLEPDRYLAIDKHIELIIYGVALELGIERFREKRPRFVVTDSFEFSKLRAAPDFAIAQSLFSHLTLNDISACLKALQVTAAAGCRFFATFCDEGTVTDWHNPERSHSHGHFQYAREQMEAAGRDTGWSPRYIGAWGHPRDQKMIEFSLVS
jgi:hypothetical protein